MSHTDITKNLIWITPLCFVMTCLSIFLIKNLSKRLNINPDKILKPISKIMPTYTYFCVGIFVFSLVYYLGNISK